MVVKKTINISELNGIACYPPDIALKKIRSGLRLVLINLSKAQVFVG
jgi:hypothetical protein